MSPCPFAQRITSVPTPAEFTEQKGSTAKQQEAESRQCPFQHVSGTSATGGDEWTYARSETLLCPVCHTPPGPFTGGYAVALPCTHVYCGPCAANGVRDCLLCAATITSFVNGPEHVKEDALFADIRRAVHRNLTLRTARQCVLLGVERREPWLLEAATQTYARELHFIPREPESDTHIRDHSATQVIPHDSDEQNANKLQQHDLIGSSATADDLLDREWCSNTGPQTRALYAVTCGVLAEMKLTTAQQLVEAKERWKEVCEAYRYTRTSVDLLLDLDWMQSPVMEQALHQSLIRLEWAGGLLRETLRSITKSIIEGQTAS